MKMDNIAGKIYFESRVIADDPVLKYCYPCSLALTRTGRLMATFSGRWRDENKTLFCQAYMAYSDDLGKNWSKPAVIFGEHEPYEGEAPKGQNFWDPSLGIYNDRIETYCQSTRRLSVGKDEDWSKSWERCRYSTDNGKTWSPMKEIKHKEKYFCGLVHKVLILKDGTAVRGFSCEMQAEKGIETMGEGEMVYSTCLLRSRDNGKTWENGAYVTVEGRAENAISFANHGAVEPSYIQLADGSLYMLLRTGTNNIYETRSYDGGLTWDEPKPSPFSSHNTPSALLDIGNGEVMVVYNNHPVIRTALSVRISSDGCRTWSEPKVIAPAGFCGEEEAAYPVAELLPDGSIAVVWGEYRKKSATDKYKVCMARFTREWILA